MEYCDFFHSFSGPLHFCQPIASFCSQTRVQKAKKHLFFFWNDTLPEGGGGHFPQFFHISSHSENLDTTAEKLRNIFISTFPTVWKAFQLFFDIQPELRLKKAPVSGPRRPICTTVGFWVAGDEGDLLQNRSFWKVMAVFSLIFCRTWTKRYKNLIISQTPSAGSWATTVSHFLTFAKHR